MPRRSRLVVPDLPVHVVHRGHNRMPCFGDPRDYLVYLALLQEAAERFTCAVHAYCLMTNHVHLLVTPNTGRACAQLIHRVAQRYAYYFNRKHHRTGTLWEGRFRSSIVERSAYLIACYRYIELNPVRAGMVPRPDDYQWSSYAGNVGMRMDPLLSPHPEFLALGKAAYLRHMADVFDPDLLQQIREAADSGLAFGGEQFKATLELQHGRKMERGRAGRPCKATENKSEPVPDLFSADRVS